jgi:hypothetical protein
MRCRHRRGTTRHRKRERCGESTCTAIQLKVHPTTQLSSRRWQTRFSARYGHSPTLCDSPAFSTCIKQPTANAAGASATTTATHLSLVSLQHEALGRVEPAPQIHVAVSARCCYHWYVEYRNRYAVQAVSMLQCRVVLQLRRPGRQVHVVNAAATVPAAGDRAAAEAIRGQAAAHAVRRRLTGLHCRDARPAAAAARRRSARSSVAEVVIQGAGYRKSGVRERAERCAATLFLLEQ